MALLEQAAAFRWQVAELYDQIESLKAELAAEKNVSWVNAELSSQLAGARTERDALKSELAAIREMMGCGDNDPLPEAADDLLQATDRLLTEKEMLLKRCEELHAQRESTWRDFIEQRGVETPCGKCSGLGVCAYGSTATWSGGIGGQAMTSGICDKCWGSGDATRPWLNLRTLRHKERALIEALDIIQWLMDLQNGCPLPSFERNFERENKRAREFLAQHQP